jgi:hypothetical protein
MTFIGFAIDSVANLHFQLTVGTLLKLGFNLNNSNTMAPTSCATCLGIYFDIQIGFLEIPHTKLQELLFLCKISGSAWLFNVYTQGHQTCTAIPCDILVFSETWEMPPNWPSMRALARTSGGLWDAFMQLMVQLQPRLNVFVDASLHGLGGPSVLMFIHMLWSPNQAGALHIRGPSMFLSFYKFFSFY